MQVYKVLTKYNVVEELHVGVAGENTEDFLVDWGNKILLVMTEFDMLSVYDEDVPGITINITDDINVNYAPNNMNITYQQITDNPERNPVFTVNNMRISMYPNISAMKIEVGPVTINTTINVAEGDVLFRALMRGTRLYRNARNIGEINEPNENDGNIAEENDGSARRVGKKSGYNNSGNYPDAKKKKSSRKTRKARKN